MENYEVEKLKEDLYTIKNPEGYVRFVDRKYIEILNTVISKHIKNINPFIIGNDFDIDNTILKFDKFTLAGSFTDLFYEVDNQLK